MVGIFTFEVVIAIIGVLGTWIGVYFGYKAIKKNNEKIFTNMTTLINSKINTQVGRGNQNVQ
ncbi:hypothetical protein KAJ87_00575 [Candidatus Pacearchaeota archaeon]|nr:hypothetical protein [Candidatus Pacearchaeota archaeon]